VGAEFIQHRIDAKFEYRKKIMRMEFSDLDGNTIFKCFLKEWGERMWIGFWLIQCRENRKCAVKVMKKDGKFRSICAICRLIRRTLSYMAVYLAF
jgi:hypothetical protein